MCGGRTRNDRKYLEQKNHELRHKLQSGRTAGAGDQHIHRRSNP